MKVTASQKLLNKGLGVVSRSISLKATLPVLNNVMISTDKGRLRLSSTNLESGVHYWIGAKIEAEGSTTVPARVLTDFVSSLDENDSISLELEEDLLKVTSSSNRAQLATIGASEFPKVPVLEDAPSLEINLKEFAKAVNQVSFASSVDEGRPVLTGVLIKVGKGETELVATDGYRLAKKKIKTTSTGEIETIIPARTLQEVARVCSDSEEEFLGITPMQNQLLFSLGQVQVVSRVIDGTFPNYEQIIPKETVTKFSMPKAKFSQALKVASIFAKDLGNVVRLEVNDSGEVTLTANTAQVGEGLSRTEAEVQGSTLKTAFNAKYLSEALNVIEGDKVFFESAGAVNPTIIKGEIEGDFFSLIMPVRIQN